MIIFGWGKQLAKYFGDSAPSTCPHCNNKGNQQLRRYRTWFTLFFVPLIPYATVYVKQCPICSYAEILSKEDFMHVVADPSTAARSKAAEKIQSSYDDGLTETQRNYRREMAAHKARQAQEASELNSGD